MAATDRNKTATRRQRAEQAGRRAELVASWWMRLKGYQVLDQRVKLPGGEIDLVARRGRQLVFAEIKYRRNIDEAMQAITRSQQHRIASAAGRYLAGRPDLQELNSRFDAILLAPRKMPRHILDAWRV